MTIEIFDAEQRILNAYITSPRLELPDCLKNIADQRTIWICQDGSWQTYKPLPDEEYKYFETIVNIPVSFKSRLKWDEE